MKVQQIEYQDTKRWLLEKHYAKRMPSISYAFGLVVDDYIIGVVTYGMPPTPFLSRLFNKGQYLELNRLVINNSCPKNSASFLISKSLKLLKNLGEFVIVSYADPNQGHTGFVYQATNWLYTGVGRVNQKDKRGVNKFYFLDKEYHERHIPETMVRLGFNIDANLTKNQNWINNGGEILAQQRKHRYFFVVGGKRFKKMSTDKIKSHFKVYNYPKEPSRKYECVDIKECNTRLF